MYFWCFGFRGELGFLNCDDVCMCVVNKQFELLEFVSESVYVDLQYDEISLTFTAGPVCLCGVSSPVVVVVVVYPLPWPLRVGGVRCSRLWSTSQLLRPSGQQCSHFGGVCPQIQGRQCGAYVVAVEEMMCVVCVDVTEGE